MSTNISVFSQGNFLWRNIKRKKKKGGLGRDQKEKEKGQISYPQTLGRGSTLQKQQELRTRLGRRLLHLPRVKGERNTLEERVSPSEGRQKKSNVLST